MQGEVAIIPFRRWKVVPILTVLLAAATTPVSAGPYEDGVAAWDKGDYAKALAI